MIEVLSIVSFSNSERVQYLKKSFGTFHNLYPQVHHVVIDGSPELGSQQEFYNKLNLEWYHRRTSYGERLKFGLTKLNEKYFVFLPDDYEWIFRFPLEEAIKQCEKEKVDVLKLTPRGMRWYSSKKPVIRSWYKNNKLLLGDLFLPDDFPWYSRLLYKLHRILTAGERLHKKGSLFISKRHWRRSFYEQFSLGSHLIRRKFIEKTLKNLKNLDMLASPGLVEKAAYKYLLIHKYTTAYFNMWTPTFHFLDRNIEGDTQAHKIGDMLIEQNYKLYNQYLNMQDG